jgi:multidrug efflux system membrane fusion protein
MDQEPDHAAVTLAPKIAPTPPVVQAPPEQHRNWLRLLIGIFALLALFIAWEVLTSFVAFTDDAYVRSDLVAITPQVTGPIITVAVRDNQPVHRGDLLARIDPTPFQLNVDAAKAELTASQAQAQAGQDSVSGATDNLHAALAAQTEAQQTQGRALALAHEGYASDQAMDRAIATYGGAAANVAAARAAIAHAQTLLAAQQAAILQATAELQIAQWKLRQTTLLAPLDGTVNNLTLQVGDTAYPGKPLIGIVAADAWRIVANYKQGYLRQLHPGGTAWVMLDTHPWHLYRARIRGIGRGIARNEGQATLLPYVTPTTDWIRLQHRFPVTLDLINPPADLTYYMGADASCVVFP